MKAKKILVEFECQVGDYTHNSHYIFDKQMSNWRYCKEFWGIDNISLFKNRNNKRTNRNIKRIGGRINEKMAKRQT